MSRSAARKREPEAKIYLNQISTRLRTGKAKEHTYRPALQALVEGFESGILALNDPARIQCGAPDFLVLRGRTPLGYIEAKDIGTDLDEEESSEQLTRYRASLGNLILTDYIVFKWYVNGVHRKTVNLARKVSNRVIEEAEGERELLALFSAFLNVNIPVISSAEELAQRLAGTTQCIRDSIHEALKLEEPKKGRLSRWIKAFREVLISDLSPEEFSDMFAQTLAYGLFAARMHHDGRTEFSTFSAGQVLPKTNPFLRKLFRQFMSSDDLPETVSWAVDEIVEILKRIDVGAVRASFSEGSRKADPVVHFYETFLTSYDPTTREKRGVYYTPSPVVGYIVRSIDQILRSEFAKEDGLANPETMILDPAVGTGSFLHQAVSCIHESVA